MKYKIIVDGYRPIVRDKIITFKDKPIEISIGELLMRIVFLRDDGEPRVQISFDDKVATTQFYNINKKNSVVGIFEPFEIGYNEHKDPIFFSCILTTEDSKDGNRSVDFIFWEKEQKNEVLAV